MRRSVFAFATAAKSARLSVSLQQIIGFYRLNYRLCLDKWLNPNVGDMPLANANSQVMKQLVGKMDAAGLSQPWCRRFCSGLFLFHQQNVPTFNHLG